MSRIRNIITTTLVGTATAFGVVSSANYCAHKVHNTVAHAGEEILDSVVKEVAVPLAGGMIGEAVKTAGNEIGEKVIGEILLPGYNEMLSEQKRKEELLTKREKFTKGNIGKY